MNNNKLLLREAVSLKIYRDVSPWIDLLLFRDHRWSGARWTPHVLYKIDILRSKTNSKRINMYTGNQNSVLQRYSRIKSQKKIMKLNFFETE